ncbi:fused MFS/spermidine synthase [Bradyrhizobium sp. OK095]|jgi:spermidine synthase|uniref:spermidine synthase n=1 Tax=Bradyrhizobium sp. OK095 TaxID=1882760 RepID=UPI0008BF7D8F|nr:fused MFS/spermidine synthase [Bradyrhizobium sp. OK095]SEN88379.1 spermidine synthase [Bradyrhizobium sp. OK095]
MFIRSVIFSTLAIAFFGIGAASAQNPPPMGPPRLLESRESLYNNIYVYDRSPYVILTFGHNKQIYTESVFNTADDRDLLIIYTQFMTASLMYARNVHAILEIGTGGGRTAWYLHRFLPDVSVTSVELDPAVVEMSRKYFALKDEANFRVEAQDGRLFLSQSKDKYDVIMIDAYRGPFVPFHLLTREFYQIVRDHLTEGGVVVQNVASDTMLFDAAMKTIGAVFPQLEFYRNDDNFVTVAYDGPARKPEELAAVAAERDKAYGLRYPLAAMLAERKRVDLNDVKMISDKATVLTDDFAPVESLKSIERHNRKIP